jgi:hypothetical protein
MRGPLLLIFAVAMTAVMLAPGGAPLVHACTLPNVPLEERVAQASLIFSGVVLEEFIEPPLDPSVPDELRHWRMVTFEASEYLKGSGEASYVYQTETLYEFDDKGNVVTGQGTCGSFGSTGTPYLVLADADGNLQWPPVRLDTEPGQAFLAQVLGVLNATPTPVPTASAPTSSPAPTQTPAQLPQSGGQDSNPHADELLVVSVATMLVAAVLSVAFVRFWTKGSP